MGSSFLPSDLHWRFQNNVFTIITIFAKHIVSEIQPKPHEEVFHRRRVAQTITKIHKVEVELFGDVLLTLIYSLWP